MNQLENLQIIVTDLQQKKAQIDRMLPTQLRFMPNIAAVINDFEETLRALENCTESLLNPQGE